jgi:hypothetical protein
MEEECGEEDEEERKKLLEEISLKIPEMKDVAQKLLQKKKKDQVEKEIQKED